MCVIAYKPKNVRWMDKSDMKDCWIENPHGAGVMWRDEESNTIRFKKGFMKYDELEKWCDENMSWLENTECALHFRITTHGGTSEGNCHPFVCDCEADPHQLEGEAKYVMMHNGMLDITPRAKDISDSAELALRVGEYENPQHVMSIFGEMLLGNRIIVMGPESTQFYGEEFVKPIDNGWLYSNDHFAVAPTVFSWEYGYEDRVRKYPRDGMGWKYDHQLKCWLDKNGYVVDIEEVDPDYLDDKDYDEYTRQMFYDDADAYEWLESNGFPIDVAEAEAMECGMTIGEYVDEYLRGCHTWRPVSKSNTKSKKGNSK